MKKFAFILMGPQYDMEKHQSAYETPGHLTSIFTVNTFEDARKRALQCREEGYGCIELCGAFGEEKTREIIELTGGQMAVGYVIHLPEQDELFERFFGG